jgi:hypothetical protein
VIPLNFGANANTVRSVKTIGAAFTVLCVIRTRFVRSRWRVSATLIPTAWQVLCAKPKMQDRVMNASAAMQRGQYATVQNVTLKWVVPTTMTLANKV